MLLKAVHLQAVVSDSIVALCGAHLKCSPALQLDALEDVAVPQRLVPEDRLAAMQAKYQPHFIPLARAVAHDPMSANDPRPPADPVSGAPPCRTLRLMRAVTQHGLCELSRTPCLQRCPSRLESGNAMPCVQKCCLLSSTLRIACTHKGWELELTSSH